MTIQEYAQIVNLFDKSETEKSIFLGYFGYRFEKKMEFSVTDIINWFDILHLPKPNTSRLKTNLSKSRSLIKGSHNGLFKLHANSLSSITTQIPSEPETKVNSIDYVDNVRLEEMRKIASISFDITKLIRLCEELNCSFRNGCYISVAMLVRAVIDHVPPIFGCSVFSEVANNYPGSKSFRESMQNLANSSRKISDSFLHTQVRKKEVLPTKTQVDFSNDLDTLLSEIVRILK